MKRRLILLLNNIDILFQYCGFIRCKEFFEIIFFNFKTNSDFSFHNFSVDFCLSSRCLEKLIIVIFCIRWIFGILILEFIRSLLLSLTTNIIINVLLRSRELFALIFINFLFIVKFLI
jgi:hypothetical protein